MRWLTASPIVSTLLFTFGFASSAHAGATMFGASFIFHAWGNDISSATTYPTQYTTNDWTAAPLGFDCQHKSPLTVNGAPSPRYCSPALRQQGYQVIGSWTASIGAGTPPKITLAKSAIRVSGVTGFRPTAPPYLQSWTYATFVNAAASFFASGGAAAGAGFQNKTVTTGTALGTWRIVAGKNAFGGVMGLLGRYGRVGKYTITGKTGT
jgi:hypothetical protein